MSNKFILHLGSDRQVLDQFSKETGLPLSVILRMGAMKLVGDKSLNKQLINSAKKREKIYKLNFFSEELKFDLKVLFYAKNSSKKLAQGIQTCTNKKHLINVIDSYINIAQVMEEKVSVNMLKKFKSQLRTAKLFETTKAQLIDFVVDKYDPNHIGNIRKGFIK